MQCTITLAMLAGLTSVLAAASNNIQTFTGDLGGAAPAVTEDDTADRPFSVNGATFLKQAAALQRSCAVQHNACAAVANGGDNDADIEVADCDAQEDDCKAAAASAAQKRAPALDFGDCANPAVEFAPQADRGDVDAFAAVDQDAFNHGSANNINVISGFICSQLGSSCGAAEEAVDACAEAQAAADGLSGQDAADAFNGALGVSA